MELLLKFDIALFPIWLPSKVNRIADALSRQLLTLYYAELALFQANPEGYFHSILNERNEAHGSVPDVYFAYPPNRFSNDNTTKFAGAPPLLGYD